MNRDDSAAVVIVVGLTAAVIALSNVLVRYLRPTMARWLLLAGAVMIVLGVTLVAGRWRSESPRTDGQDAKREHHPVSRMGWMLLAPILVAIIVDPGALGSYAVSSQSTLQTPAPGVFDLEAHLRSGSFAGQAVDISVLQLWRAVDDGKNLDLLTDTPLSLVGFVVNDDQTKDGFVLARLVMGCCAGDALAVTVEIRGDPPPDLPNDTWVRAEVNFDPTATAELTENDDLMARAAVVNLVGLEKIDVPSEPYLYPW